MALWCRDCERLVSQRGFPRDDGTCRWCGSPQLVMKARGPQRKVKDRVLKDAVCVSCGTAHDLTIDHILPLKLGGTNRIENLQPMCEPCNQRKGHARTIASLYKR